MSTAYGNFDGAAGFVTVLGKVAAIRITDSLSNPNFPTQSYGTLTITDGSTTITGIQPQADITSGLYLYEFPESLIKEDNGAFRTGVDLTVTFTSTDGQAQTFDTASLGGIEAVFTPTLATDQGTLNINATTDFVLTKYIFRVFSPTGEHLVWLVRQLTLSTLNAEIGVEVTFSDATTVTNYVENPVADVNAYNQYYGNFGTADLGQHIGDIVFLGDAFSGKSISNIKAKTKLIDSSNPFNPTITEVDLNLCFTSDSQSFYAKFNSDLLTNYETLNNDLAPLNRRFYQQFNETYDTAQPVSDWAAVPLFTRTSETVGADRVYEVQLSYIDAIKVQDNIIGSVENIDFEVFDSSDVSLYTGTTRVLPVGGDGDTFTTDIGFDLCDVTSGGNWSRIEITPSGVDEDGNPLPVISLDVPANVTDVQEFRSFYVFDITIEPCFQTATQEAIANIGTTLGTGLTDTFYAEIANNVFASLSKNYVNDMLTARRNGNLVNQKKQQANLNAAKQVTQIIMAIRDDVLSGKVTGYKELAAKYCFNKLQDDVYCYGIDFLGLLRKQSFYTAINQNRLDCDDTKTS